MLRGALAAVNGTPVNELRTRGPEASFLLSGDIPLTFRPELPSASKLVEGQWWSADYQGPPLVSLHQSLRSGLGVKIGDELTFAIFGDTITAKVASFRDYSWQGGIDFLATFSPGVLEGYPATLLGAVTAAPGREDAVERAPGRGLARRALHRHRRNARTDHRRAGPAIARRIAGRRPCGRQRPSGPAGQPCDWPPAAPGRCRHHQGARRQASPR